MWHFKNVFEPGADGLGASKLLMASTAAELAAMLPAFLDHAIVRLYPIPNVIALRRGKSARQQGESKL
jgi:hypothetical protein